MIRLYSKRLLSPFVGLVQVAEIARARALSLDGKNWAIQYELSAEETGIRRRTQRTGTNINYSLVATIEDGQLKKHAVHPFLDPGDVQSAIDRLFDAVSSSALPYTETDRYEYWLLDRADGSPLALLHSCIDAKDRALTPTRPTWIAMSAAQLAIQAPQSGYDAYVPPVNYRLQKLIEQRAGIRPRAVWFERSTPQEDDFPPCLINEDWDNAERQQLCDLYIRRLAPRLLMLHNLPRAVRQRLEQAARNHVFDVDRFYPLYPEVVDSRSLTAARVEARLRRAAET